MNAKLRQCGSPDSHSDRLRDRIRIALHDYLGLNLKMCAS